MKRDGMDGYYLSDGIDFRFEDFVEVVKVLFVLGILVYMATVINQFIPMTMFLDIVPLFYAVLTIMVVVGVLGIPEYGPIFTVGWTIASLILAGVGLIGVGELLLDLIPIAIVVYEALQNSSLGSWDLGGL